MNKITDDMDELLKLRSSIEKEMTELSTKLDAVNKNMRDIKDNEKLTLELASRYLDNYIGKIITFTNHVFTNQINIVKLTEYKLSKFSVKNIDLFYEKGFYYSIDNISLRLLAQGGSSSITISRDELESIKLYESDNEFIKTCINTMNEFNEFIK